MACFYMNPILALLWACSLYVPSFTGTEPAVHTVVVHAAAVVGEISPRMMGFNSIYSHERDDWWQRGHGSVPQQLKAIGTGVLRYPGGTVTTFYHWEHPTGQGWADSWSPGFDASANTPPTEWMDIDEYLAVAKHTGIEPLVGINMGSGKKHDRLADGVAEAVRLVRHCIASGVAVTYYYLDNEPYHETANYTFTAREYADHVNTYAEAMREVDPNIRIIVNTHPNNKGYTRTLLEVAGHAIDYVDIHFYWRFRRASYDRWKSELEMTHHDNTPYRLQREKFKSLANRMGHPEIELISLEWNIGPPDPKMPSPTQAQAALMVSEQYIQLLESGMEMACFWPISWPRQTNWSNRMLLDPQRDNQPNYLHGMFALFAPILGHQHVMSQSHAKGLVQLAAKSDDGNTLWVYLVNKMPQDEESVVEVVLEGFPATSYAVERFMADEQGAVSLPISKIEEILAPGPPVELVVPRYSFSKITFKR